MADDPITVLEADDTLRPLITEHGRLSLEPAEDDFRRLITSIIRQQVSNASAEAIQDRVFSTFTITPAGIATADPADLRDAGLSRQKAEYVQNVARAFQHDGYGREHFNTLSDDDVIDELTSIRGIGTWTAKMYLMFCLARQDVFPVEDLGIRRGMQGLYNNDLTRTDMTQIADAWRPYRSYASLYVWRSRR